MWSCNIARQRGPWALNGLRGLVKRPQILKSAIFSIMYDTLLQPSLSHVDFLDDPAAIQWSRLIISCTTQDASPNELTNPEICMKNRPNPIYSFLGSWPAVFPACVISSHACIVLLSEASSSSHVILQHCASARTLGSERSPGPRQTSPNPEICNILNHVRYLVTA